MGIILTPGIKNSITARDGQGLFSANHRPSLDLETLAKMKAQLTRAVVDAPKPPFITRAHR